MLVGMKDAWEEIDGNDDIRCAILTGAGGTFCAGMDLKAMGGSDAEKYQSRMAEDPDLHWKALLRHYDLRKPLIAAVEGWAVAGGTEILQATDIRVAGEGAVFGVFEAKRGLFPLGRLDGAAAPADPLHARHGAPADRPRGAGGGGAAHRADRPRRPRRHGARQGAGDRRASSGRTGRWRWRRSSGACARPRACPRWTAWPASSRSAGPSSPPTTPPRGRRPSPRSARPTTPARERRGRAGGGARARGGVPRRRRRATSTTGDDAARTGWRPRCGGSSGVAVGAAAERRGAGGGGDELAAAGGPARGGGPRREADPQRSRPRRGIPRTTSRPAR